MKNREEKDYLERAKKDRRKEKREDFKKKKRELTEEEEKERKRRKEEREKRREEVERKMSSEDVFWGGLFIILTIVGGIFGTAIGFPGAWLSAIILLVLGVIIIRFPKIQVGSKAQYLFLGKRIQYFVKEGRHVVPWPFFKIKEVDCRAKTTKMDEENIFTKDNVEVKVEKPSIVWKIMEIDRYQDLNPENLSGLLDDVVDENVRQVIRDTSLEDVLGMKFSVENEDIIHSLDTWGIDILKIIVPDVVPVNKDFIEAQELQTKEALERDGQRVEARHHADLIKFFSGNEKLGKEGPIGPGLPVELANEAALIHMNKTEKKKLASSTFGLNADTVNAIVKAVVRR